MLFSPTENLRVRSRSRTAAAFLAVVCAVALPVLATAQDTEIVVVFPGGPEPGSSGQRVIDDFVAKINESAPSPIKGVYFNDSDQALAHLKAQPKSFILGSTGFFLAARKELNLVPMAQVTLPDNKPEQYFLVAQKGKFPNLDSMKGANVVGAPFYESEEFVDRIIFGGKIDASAFFAAEATPRPLSALRKLSSGEIGGVLLSATQYHSLSSLPLAEEVELVFESEPIPSVGLMRIDNEETATLADPIRETLLQLSQTPEGVEVAKGFGVTGFEPIEPSEVDSLVKKYENP